jgi:hypothetical protein
MAVCFAFNRPALTSPNRCHSRRQDLLGDDEADADLCRPRAGTRARAGALAEGVGGHCQVESEGGASP